MLANLQGHTDHVCCVAIRGDLIASGSRDKTIRLWSKRAGSCTATLTGCEALIYGIALREGGELLLSGEGSQAGGKVRLWSLKGGRNEVVATFAEHTGPVWSVAMGARALVSTSHDMKAKVWPIDANGEGVASVATLAHPNWVFSCSIDGDLLATGCGDRCVRLWSLSTFNCLRTLEHGVGIMVKPVFSVRMHGGVLVSGGEDHAIRVWSLAGEAFGELIATLQHGATVRGLAVTSKGYIISSGGSTKKLIVWHHSGK